MFEVVVSRDRVVAVDIASDVEDGAGEALTDGISFCCSVVSLVFFGLLALVPQFRSHTYGLNFISIFVVFFIALSLASRRLV